MSVTNGSTEQAAWPSAGRIQPIDEDTTKQTPVESSKESSNVPKAKTNTVKSAPTKKTPKKRVIPDWLIASKPEKEKSAGYLGRLIYWKVYTKWLIDKKFVSPPSMSGNVRAEIRRNRQFIKDNRAQARFVVGAISKTGGAMKSTTSHLNGAFVASEIRGGAMLIGLDMGNDKTEARFAKKKDALLPATELLIATNAGSYIPPMTLLMKTETDADTGLVLVKAKSSHDKVTTDFDRYETARMLQTMNWIYPFTVCDSGAGLNIKVTEGIVQASDIILIPNRGISEETMDDIRETIQHPPYNLGNRLDRVIVVINDLSRKQLNARTQYNVAAKCGVAPENVILIPHDRYLDYRVQDNLKRVSIPALANKKTELMHSRLAKREFEIADVFLNKSSAPQTP